MAVACHPGQPTGFVFDEPVRWRVLLLPLLLASFGGFGFVVVFGGDGEGAAVRGTLMLAVVATISFVSTCPEARRAARRRRQPGTPQQILERIVEDRVGYAVALNYLIPGAGPWAVGSPSRAIWVGVGTWAALLPIVAATGASPLWFFGCLGAAGVLTFPVARNVAVAMAVRWGFERDRVMKAADPLSETCPRCGIEAREWSGWCGPCHDLLAAHPIAADHVVVRLLSELDQDAVRGLQVFPFHSHDASYRAVEMQNAGEYVGLMRAMVRAFPGSVSDATHAFADPADALSIWVRVAVDAPPLGRMPAVSSTRLMRFAMRGELAGDRWSFAPMGPSAPTEPWIRSRSRWPPEPSAAEGPLRPPRPAARG